MLAAVQPPVFQPPAPSASPAAPGTDAGPDRFAQLLNAADAQRQAEHPPAATPQHTPPAHRAAGKPAAAGPAPAPPAQAASGRSALGGKPAQGQTAADGAAASDGGPDTGLTDEADLDPGADMAGTDPAALLASLVGLNGVPHTAPPAAAGPGATDADGEGRSARTSAAGSARAQARLTGAADAGAPLLGMDGMPSAPQSDDVAAADATSPGQPVTDLPGAAAVTEARMAPLRVAGKPGSPATGAPAGAAAPYAHQVGVAQAQAQAQAQMPLAATATQAATPPVAQSGQSGQSAQAVQATQAAQAADLHGAFAAAAGDDPAQAARPLPAGADPAAGPAGTATLPFAVTSSPTATAAAAPAQAQLAAAPGSPDFARELGAQLTTFVRNGVQHARLELHPTDLGPVTVQIQLDGNQAHVRLAAEHAHTRQALEQALPTLAGNLREAGLTLSGGGVSDQPQQPQQQGGDPSSSTASRGRTGGQRADIAPAAPSAAPRPRGVVDLVA